MRIHEIIRSCRRAIVEGDKHEVYAATGDPFVIFENPSPGQLIASRRATQFSKKVKGVMTPNGDLYIWPAYYAHHGDVMHYLGFIGCGLRLEMGIKGPALSGRNPETDDAFSANLHAQEIEVLRNSPHLKRLYGTVFPIEVIQTAMPMMMGVYHNAPETAQEIKAANNVRKRLDLPRIRSSLTMSVRA